jgi:uncharacterized DUF497 family protein
MTENKAQPEKLDLRSQDTGEARVITFGVSTSGRLLVVAHTEDGDTIRIITARPATAAERKIYEEE